MGRLLQVRPGELGLRQSDALFQHVKQLPQLMEQLASQGQLENIQAVGASTRPRAVEGSYMPCFWGTSQAQCLARTLGVPFFAFLPPAGTSGGGSLVRRAAGSAGGAVFGLAFVGGHHRAAAGRAGAGWSSYDGGNLGGTSDISAGQLIDRTGVLLGLQVPRGQGVGWTQRPGGRR